MRAFDELLGAIARSREAIPIHSLVRRPAVSPPRVVAISGVIFSALYIASLVLVRLAVPADPKDPVRFPINGFDMGSLSMRSAILG